MKKLLLGSLSILFISFSHIQAQTSTLYVTGTVSSGEKMLVTVGNPKYIEGQVVNEPYTVRAEFNGKITEARTDNKGHAILDFSAIAGDLAGSGIAVIKSFDKNGNLLSTVSTTVHQGSIGAPAQPVIEQLPKNLSNGEAVTIPGKNLGTDAKLFCGNQEQETLAASSNELIVFTNAKTGIQPVYVVTPNGVSESQKVNFYSLDFSIPKSSIKPRENVQAMVHYESIPAGTKLIFTNKSPETITMEIPGAENTANESVYTVTEEKGSFPVKITGIRRGPFLIKLETDIPEKPDDATVQNNRNGEACADFINLLQVALKEKNIIPGNHSTIDPAEDMTEECYYWMCAGCGKQWTCYLNFCPRCWAEGKGKIKGIRGPKVSHSNLPKEPNSSLTGTCADFINIYTASLASAGALPALQFSTVDPEKDMDPECYAWQCPVCQKVWTCYLNFCPGCWGTKGGVKNRGTKQCSKRCDYMDDRPNPSVQCRGMCVRPAGHGGDHTCKIGHK